MTMPIPAGPGFPRLPPSNSRINVSSMRIPRTRCVRAIWLEIASFLRAPFSSRVSGEVCVDEVVVVLAVSHALTGCAIDEPIPLFAKCVQPPRDGRADAVAKLCPGALLGPGNEGV